jgi:hypothetical protein
METSVRGSPFKFQDPLPPKKERKENAKERARRRNLET